MRRDRVAEPYSIPRWHQLLALFPIASALAVVIAVAAIALVDVGGKGVADEAQAAPAPSQATVTLSWVGDITMGSSYGLPPEAGGQMFSEVSDLISAADLSIGNLEGTFSVGGASKCAGSDSSACFAFQAPPENALALKTAGFDLMNLANNHAYDFGEDGQRQTIHALDRAHIAHAGLPGSVTHREINGRRLAIIGFAPYPWATSLHDLAGADTIIRAAAAESDIVVVLMHAGAEGSDQTTTPYGVEFSYGEDRGDTRAFARIAVEAGADLVLGSGPHVIRGIERYRGRLIAYSLGNFAGYQNFGMGGNLSLSGLLQVTLASDGRLLGGRWHSLRLEGPGLPVLDTTHQSARLVDQLSRDDFTGMFAIDEVGQITP